ncbi:MAG: hypothetical protein IKJ45_13670, partial [Kiritimatiellae bacterium]|nr:hypothetical protein [Kiritimatiellia bacterium]
QNVKKPSGLIRFFSVFLLPVIVFLGSAVAYATVMLIIDIFKALFDGAPINVSIPGIILVYGVLALLILARIKLRKRVVEWKSPEKIKQEKEKKKIAWICVAIAVVMLGGAFLFANRPRETNKPKTREEILDVIENLYPDEKETETWDITITFD